MNVDHPVSLMQQKANELIAHSYSHLYNLPTTGLDFTVYGPYGRPDMALFFTKSIIEDTEINIFNNGKMMRDFTILMT